MAVAAAVVLCGFFDFDEWSGRPLFDLLPRVVCVEAETDQAHMLRRTLEQLADETCAPGLGSEVVISRLADALLVQTRARSVVIRPRPRGG